MIYEIQLIDLLWLLFPLITAVFIVRYLNISDIRTHVIPILRMIVQLIAVGYLLKFIFDSASPYSSLAVAFVMITAASWIGLRHVAGNRLQLMPKAMLCIGISGGFILFLCITQILHSDPWYNPKTFIPVAGMIFANAMTGIGITCERLISELKHSEDIHQCHRQTMQAALIPITNACLAIGFVSLPGMMTGQILSGVSPLIAVRYQAMVMMSIYTAVMLASLIFMKIATNQLRKIASAS